MNTRSETILPALLAVCSLVMLVALLIGGRGAEWVFALSVVLFPCLLIALGVGRGLRRLRGVLVTLALVYGLSAAGVLGLSGGDGSGDAVLGLPPAALLMLGGLGLVPLGVVLWSYAATFDDDDG